MAYYLNVDRFGNEQSGATKLNMRFQIPSRNLGAGVLTPLTTLTQTHNTHPANWNNTTGTFTAPSAGYYEVSGQLISQGTFPTGGWLALDVYKNGAIDTRWFNQAQNPTSQFLTTQGYQVLYLNAGDTIQFRAQSTVANVTNNNTTANYVTINQL